MPSPHCVRCRSSTRAPPPPQRPGVANWSKQEPSGTDASERDRDAYQATFEQAAIGIAHTTLDGRWLRANPKFCEILGYSREELLGLTIADLTYAPDMERERPLLLQLTTGDISMFTFEKRYVRRDGTFIPASVKVSLVRDAQGAPAYLIGFVEDISPRKAVEAALQAQTATLAQAEASAVKQVRYLEAVIEAITDGVSIFDAAGQSVYLNRVARRNVGLADDEQQVDFPGLFSRLLVRDLEGHPIPLDQWPLMRSLHGESFAGDQAIDILFRSLRDEECVLSLTGGPIYDAQGSIMGAVMIGRDVTAQHRKGRQRQEALHAIFDLGALLLATPTPEAPPLSVSLLSQIMFIFPAHSAAIVRFTAADQPWEVLATVGLTPDQAALLQPAQLLSQQMPGIDEQQRFEQGETLFLDQSHPYAALGAALGISQTLIVPLLTSERLIGALCLNLGADQRPFTSYEQTLIEGLARFGALVLDRDRLLSERETAQSRVLALEEAKWRMNEFLAIASHELRTPLTSIDANLQIFNQRLGKLAQAPAAAPLVEQFDALRPLLDANKSAIKRLNRLIGDLVEVTRIQAGKLQMQCSRFDLATLTRHMVAELQARWPDRQFVIAAPLMPVLITSDADRVQQVLENFLTNALKYSPLTEPIAITLEECEDRVRVAVQDRGPGLTPMQQQRIWERFYRVAGTEKSGGSLGLGLFIARTTIEQLGGQIGVESAPGQGATFWFEVPRIARSAEC